MDCQRCQGLMVPDRFVELFGDSVRNQMTGWRGVNCGELYDALILTHRDNQQSRRSHRGCGLLPKLAAR